MTLWNWKFAVVCSCIGIILKDVSAESTLPNILFLLIDDLGYNDVGYHKGCDYPTPNIDDLASNSLQLNNYYIQHICSPTRSALMSGRYPIHTGFQDGVIQTISPWGLPLDLTIIPQDLQRVGYNTSMIGKWHLGFFEPRYVPTSRGFQSYFGFYSAAETYFYHNATDDGVHGYDFRNLTHPIIMNNQYSTYLYGNETIRILSAYNNTDKNIRKPFFLYIAMQAIHGPLQAPKYMIDSFNTTISNINRRKLAAMTNILDDVIGQIIYFMRNETNIWDNTMIIFSTDNGGPVDGSGSNFPLRGSKGTLWEGGIKGDGFITGGWLNNDRRGKELNSLFHITDWYPTICEIVGIIPSNYTILDGYSQLNNIQNGVENGNIYLPRSEILHNIDPINCNLTICGSLRMKQYKIVSGKEVWDINTICRSTWCPLNDTNQTFTTIQCDKNGNKNNYNYPIVNNKYIENNCPYNGDFCMYDIVNDPCEWNDIKDNQQSIFKEMYDKLLAYNSTMVIPLNILNPPNKTAANPANWNGFWSPWINNSNFSQSIQSNRTQYF